MTDWLDLSATDDPRPDEPADLDLAAGAEGAAPWPEDEAGAEPLAPEVDEATVRQWLTLAGLGLNVVLPGRNYGVDEAWRATERDLDEMAPPATRILNRSPRLRSLATRADVDAFTLAAAAAAYAFRNAVEVWQARADLAAERPHIGGREEAEPAGGGLPPGMTGVPSQ